MKRFGLFAAALSLALAPLAGARPAPWYKWQSVTGGTVCAQTSPGPGWVRLDIVYLDPRCQRRDNPTGGAGKAKNGK
ncbi:MAG: hypothetical protein LBI87_06265 [Candidatus Accumulibacter sp.]|nr:hypothetical protein [Accumulibacter sp.]